jgi:2-oxoglutarate dehydrogenase E2 component (dihydrolipoamide succinyltransferase)
MTIGLEVPSLGESVTQATVGTWLKREGEAVALDEPVVEVESEKATVVVPAPAAGVLRRQIRKTGDAVRVGEAIGEIEEGPARAAPAGAGAAPEDDGPAQEAAGSTAPAGAGVPPPAHPELEPGDGQASSRRAPAPAPATAPWLSPSQRRRLAERGAPEVAAPGPTSGSGSLEGPPPAPQAPPERERLVPMSPLRRTVARRLLEAQAAAAILTTFNEVDMSRALALRERLGPAFQERHGVRLGFMSLFVKAAVEALRAFPAVNAEVRGDAILYKDHYDIGVAVGGGKGLVVPVVRDADRLSFAEVERAVAELARKARENRITMDDLAGGTFTISNGGIYGSLLSTPILNPPQSGILGLHAIQRRPVAVEGDAVAVRPMMYLALSYDHRLVDGREAVGFLVRVKECVEDPERMLLEA